MVVVFTLPDAGSSMCNAIRSLVCLGKLPITLDGQSSRSKVKVAGEAGGEADMGQKLEHERLGASAPCDRSCGPEDRRQKWD